jgi:hypothetical protein
MKPLFPSRRLRRRSPRRVLSPARPPLLFASGGNVGLGWEGNGWFSAQRCSLRPSRVRVWCPSGACKVEAVPSQWNKVLRPFLHFVVTRSGAGDGLVGLVLAGSGDLVEAPGLDEALYRSRPSSVEDGGGRRPSSLAEVSWLWIVFSGWFQLNP